MEVIGALVKKVKGRERTRRPVDTKRGVVTPYLHKMSHNLNQGSTKYGMPVKLSAHKTMQQICSQVRAEAENL